MQSDYSMGVKTNSHTLLHPEKTRLSSSPQTKSKEAAKAFKQEQTSEIKVTISSIRKIEGPAIIKELSNVLGVQPEKIREAISGLDPKEKEEFLSFASNLSKENLEHALTAAENSPQAMKAMMTTAAKLSGDNLNNYLSAAAMAGKDVMEFTQNVEQQLKTSNKDHGKHISDYLSAAAKSDDNVMNFIGGIKKFSSSGNEQINDKILNFINSEDSKKNLDNFLETLNAADVATIENVINTASQLNDNDKETFLVTAAQAGDQTKLFATDVTKILDGNAAVPSSELSNYLATAANAEGKLDVLSRVAHKMNLYFTSDLSKVDTVNFLTAAEKNEQDIDQLTDIAGQLSSNEKSNLLYATAHTNVKVSDFLNKIDNISNEQERSKFILSTANKDNKTIDSNIFMKGLLSAEEFEDFQQAGAFLAENQQNQLITSINEMDKESRKEFLGMAAGAKESTAELVDIATNRSISVEDQKTFIKTGSNLNGENLQNYIHGANAASKTSGSGTFSNFINLANKLQGSEKEDLLKTSAHAEANQMKSLMSFVNTLNPSERKSFLKTAANSGGYLSKLINMGAKVKTRPNQDFVKIFDSASNAGNHHIGKFIETFA